MSKFLLLLMIACLMIGNFFSLKSHAEVKENVETASSLSAPAIAPVEKPGVVVPTEKSKVEEGEYEVDYEEEPSGDGDSGEAPVKPKKTKKVSATQNSGGGSGGIQGSRAKHRFTPILKSETKSAYKKDGKALDVDTD
jgi:hypothetical protein